MNIGKYWMRFVCGLVSAFMLICIAPVGIVGTGDEEPTEREEPTPTPAPLEVILASPSQDDMTFPLGYRLMPSVYLGGDTSFVNAIKRVELFIDGIYIGIFDSSFTKPSNTGDLIESSVPKFMHQWKYTNGGDGFLLDEEKIYQLQAKAYSGSEGNWVFEKDSEETEIKVKKYDEQMGWNFDFEDNSEGTEIFNRLFNNDSPTLKGENAFAAQFGPIPIPTNIPGDSGKFGEKVFGMKKLEDTAVASGATYESHSAYTADGNIYKNESVDTKSPLIKPKERFRVEYDVYYVDNRATNATFIRQLTLFGISSKSWNRSGGPFSNTTVRELFAFGDTSNPNAWRYDIPAKKTNGDDVIRYTQSTNQQFKTDYWNHVVQEFNFEDRVIDLYINGERLVSQQEFDSYSNNNPTSHGGPQPVEEVGINYIRWRAAAVPARAKNTGDMEIYVDNYKIIYYTEADSSGEEGEFTIDSDNTQLTVDGDTVTATATFKNTTEEPVPATLILALYNGTDLVDVKIEDNPVVKGDVVPKTITAERDSEKTYTRATMYIFDDKNTIRPLLNTRPENTIDLNWTPGGA